MKTNVYRILKVPVIMIIGLILFLVPVKPFAQDIDLTLATQTIDIKTQMGVLISPSITKGVTGADDAVFWGFGPLPTGAVPTVVDGFTTSILVNGIQVALPAGVSASNPVPTTARLTISQTPIDPGPISVKLNLSDGTHNSQVTIAIFVTRKMDIVMVLDRSGSMATITTGTTRRWDALKSAAESFVGVYENLGRSDDRISITYFESGLTPVSMCCDLFQDVQTGIANTIKGDLDLNNPGSATALGPGLKNAQSKLSDLTRSRSILLITDGVQNVPPYVLDDGSGYSDAPGGIPAPGVAGAMRIYTVGFINPGPAEDLLKNIAMHTNGTYHHTLTGSGLEDEFEDALNNILMDGSPQLVSRTISNVPIGAPPVTLQTFPLNNQVERLILEFKAGRKFEIPQLISMMGRIKISKDGTSVLNYARPSWIGNFTNKLFLTFDFVTPPQGLPRINPAGQWTVMISDSILNIGTCKLSSIADDHRLVLRSSLGNKNAKVNDEMPIKVNLAWLSDPINDAATVKALVYMPNTDLGDALSRHSKRAKFATTPDPASAGNQKFDELWATDSAFRALFEQSENVVTLSRTADGTYEGKYSAINVSGTYKVVILVEGTHPLAGHYQRFLSQSFYASFNGVDINASGISTQFTPGKLVFTFTPVSNPNKLGNKFLVGPAMGSAFRVSNPGITIDSVEDHQDGSYTITFSGNVSDTTTLILLGQKIYTGKLAEAGEKDSFIDKIKKWLVSIGLPAWSLWVIIFLILLLLWFLFRRKK